MNRTYKCNLIQLAITLLVIKAIFSSSFILPLPSLLDNLINAFVVCVFLFKIIHMQFSLKQFLIFIYFGILIFFTSLSIKQYDILISFIAICLLMGEETNEYFKYMLKLESIILVFHVCLAFVLSFGELGKIIWVQGESIQFNGGFIHENVLSTYVFSCMLIYLWINFDKLKLKNMLFLILTCIIVYVFTRSRTTLILNILMIILVFIFSSKKRSFEIILKKTLPFLFPTISIAMFYFITHYLDNNSLILKLNELLTGRIKLGAYAFSRSGICFLPRYLDYANIGYVEWDFFWRFQTFTFDNLFSYMFIQLGVIWIITVSILIIQIIKKTNYKFHIYILLWILYSVTEIHGLNGFRYFPILLLSTIPIFRKDKNYE